MCLVDLILRSSYLRFAGPPVLSFVSFLTSEIIQRICCSVYLVGAVVELNEDDTGDVGAAGVEHDGMSVDVDLEDGKIILEMSDS